MGKRKGKSLLKLGLKRPPKRHFVPCGFGNGYYAYTTQIADGSVVEVREYLDGFMEQVPIKEISLKDMGLHRDEKTGKITKMRAG